MRIYTKCQILSISKIHILRQCCIMHKTEEKKHMIYYADLFVGGGCMKIKHSRSTKKAGIINCCVQMDGSF